MKKPEYYTADRIIEGTVLNCLWGPLCYDENAPGSIDTKDFNKEKPTAESLKRDFGKVIEEARELGLSDEEITEIIMGNLRVYGFQAETFPIEEWME